MDDFLLPFPVVRDIAIITILFGIALYVYTTRGFDFFRKRGIKHLPTYPLVGNIGSYLTGHSNFMECIINAYNAFPDQKVVGFYNFTVPSLIIRDPDLGSQVLFRDCHHFSEHIFNVDETVDPLFGKTLFALKGDKWRAMRTTLCPAFTTSKLRGFFPLLEKCCSDMINYIEENSNFGRLLIETDEFYSRFNYNVSATVALGTEKNTFKKDDEEFYQMAQNATNFIGVQGMKFTIMATFPRLSKFLRIKVVDEVLTKYFRTLIYDTISTREMTGTTRYDMMQLLIQAKKGTLNDDDLGVAAARNKDLTDDDITSQALIFLITGVITSTSTMGFGTYEIANNKDIQNKLIAEIDDVRKNSNGHITYEAIDKMEYLGQVISEILRKWPPGMIARNCVKPYTITDNKNRITHQCQPGDVIYVPTIAIQNDSFYFPDPKTFDPDRFSESRKSEIKPNTYIPFGIGPRKCIGIEFSIILAKLVMFHLLSKYTLEVSPKTLQPIELASGFMPQAKGGLWINLQRRD
uniref:Putative cytochrome n=1 Tax=Xenopsylla cheopis TaxID=163159 RepID=A0A6M2E1Z5_XENCH